MLKAWPRAAQPLTAALERTDLASSTLPRSGFVLGSRPVMVATDRGTFHWRTVERARADAGELD